MDRPEMQSEEKELIDRWAPTVGWNNIADLAPGLLGKEVMGADRWTLLHRAPASLLLWGLARHACLGRKAPKIVEIGTHTGGSLVVFLRLAAMMGGHVYSIDPKVEPLAHERAHDTGLDLAEIWTLFEGKSQDVPPVVDADFLYVDGDHGYEAVCSDMARHGVAVRDGGIIVLDDVHLTNFPGKARWIMERWNTIRPLTIGPYAILHKQYGDAPHYAKACNPTADQWVWDLPGELGPIGFRRVALDSDKAPE